MATTTNKSGGGGGGSSDEINILTWEGYQAPAWLKSSRDSGIKVNATNVGSPAEMFSKVKASPGQFDIIYNTAGWFNQYVQSDLIIPIDELRVPNVKEISDAFPWRDATTVNGKTTGSCTRGGPSRSAGTRPMCRVTTTSTSTSMTRASRPTGTSSGTSSSRGRSRSSTIPPRWSR